MSSLRVGTRNGSWDVMLGERVVTAQGVCARVTEPPVLRSIQISPSSAETHWWDSDWGDSNLCYPHSHLQIL